MKARSRQGKRAINVFLPEELVKQIRHLMIEKDISLQEWIEMLVRRELGAK